MSLPRILSSPMNDGKGSGQLESLDRLIAIEEIKQLKARYCRLIDTRDYDALASVFCKDVEFVMGEAGVAHGRELLIGWLREVLANVTTIHHGHGHEVTIDSATEAHGIQAFEDYARSGGIEIAHGAGLYTEVYRVEDGAWRIAEIKQSRFFLDWTNPMPK
jgi:hypothetical protein